MTTAFRIMVFMTLFMSAIPPSIKAMNPTKLDDATPTTTNPVGSVKDEIKCGTCPSCGTTCYTSPPSPQPSPPPPSPPPPHKKPSPTPGVNCPPPPSGGGGGGGGGLAPPDYTNIAGPPKDLYPVVQSISAAHQSFTVAPEFLMFYAILLVMVAFW